MEREGKHMLRIGIYAPISGVVQELGVREGSAVNSGALTELADLTPGSYEISERNWDACRSPHFNAVSAYPGRIGGAVVCVSGPESGHAYGQSAWNWRPGGRTETRMLADVRIH
jgi:hypothetical protein